VQLKLAMSSSTPITHYDVLGIDAETATSKDIRRAYLKQSLANHPDKNLDDVEGAKSRFVRIGEAYEVLSDPSRRAQYDRELLARRRQRRQRPSSSSQQQQQSQTYSNGYYRQQQQPAQQQQQQGYDYYSETAEAPPSAGEQSPKQPQRDYDYYGAKFDNFVAGLSEEELRAAEGLAGIVGSLVGSALLSRLGRHAPVARSALSTAGSIVGSVVGSRVGASAVRGVHEQSLERLAYEERRREAIERGEELPEEERPQPRNQLWENLRRNLDSVVENVAGAAAAGQQQQRDRQPPGRRRQPQQQQGGFNIQFQFG